MSRRKRRTLLIIVAAVLLLLAVAVFLRSKAQPEAARLLPESDGIVYIDLRPIRTHFHKQLKPPYRARPPALEFPLCKPPHMSIHPLL
jgi:flagellar basal body-associated protein FliL